MTQRKNEGGMGFRDFQFQNIAFLAKQAWRLIREPTSLWARVVKAIYFPHKNFLEATRSSKSSWMWTTLIEGKDFIKHHNRWVVGRGDAIKVYGDNWLWSGTVIPETNSRQNMLVQELIDPGLGGWNHRKINELFDDHTALKILQTPVGLTGGGDNLIWPHANDGSLASSQATVLPSWKLNRGLRIPIPRTTYLRQCGK